MPDFAPFPALRYRDDQLERLIAPPYDVLSAADLVELRARDRHNIVHIDVPVGGADRYAQAGRTWQNWLTERVVVADPEPSFTIYRMQFRDASGRERNISGVIGGLEVLDPDQSAVPPVLPHERTTKKASTDRLDLTRATRANLSPVWGLSLATGLTELLAQPGQEVGRVVVDEVRHLVERVSETTRVAQIQERVRSAAVLIADGHHRYGIARTYRDEVSGTALAAGAAHTLAFVSELIAEQLSVAAIHRVYRDIEVAEMISQLQTYFALEPITRPTAETLADMEAEGFLVLVTAAGSHKLTPRPGAFAEIRELDGLWLETALGESRAVSYQHGLAETLAAVAERPDVAAILIRPVSVAEIERTALEGLLMPPKSTFFTPKLRTGLVVRSLEPVPLG